jgi:hypothetical protein
MQPKYGTVSELHDKNQKQGSTLKLKGMPLEIRKSKINIKSLTRQSEGQLNPLPL